MAVKKRLLLSNEKNGVGQLRGYAEQSFYGVYSRYSNNSNVKFCLNRIQFQIEKKEKNKFTQLRKKCEIFK